MDGGIGHGNSQYKSKNKDTQGLKNDTEKDKMAELHGIEVIRINCNPSDFKIIKNNLIDNLSEYFDLNYVDWDEILKKSTSNIVKEICDIFNNVNSTDPIFYPYDLDIATIRRYLHRGNELGWCNYKNILDKRYDNILKMCKYKEKDSSLNADDLRIKLGLKNSKNETIYDYMAEANLLGLYNFDIEREKSIMHKYGKLKSGKKRCKKVYVYDLDNNFLDVFNSILELEKQSVEKFGVKILSQNVCHVCNGKLKRYKNLFFSYKAI